MYDALRKEIGDSDKKLQIFADINPKNDMRSMKGQWEDIINHATERLEEKCVFPITVTNPWGGRWHDFRCLDDSLEQGGGLMLITTTVPQEREWTQWKGRTARQDLSRQIKVVFSQKDAPFVHGGFGECDDGEKQPSSLVQKLLDFNDKEYNKKISNMKTELHEGLRPAEICDEYYQKHPRCNAAQWPQPDFLEQDRELRHLLGLHKPSLSTMHSFMMKFDLGQLSF